MDWRIGGLMDGTDGDLKEAFGFATMFLIPQMSV